MPKGSPERAGRADQILCKCVDCTEWNTTSVRGQPIKGQWWTKVEYAEHHQAVKAEQEAELKKEQDDIETATIQATLRTDVVVATSIATSLVKPEPSPDTEPHINPSTTSSKGPSSDLPVFDILDGIENEFKIRLRTFESLEVEIVFQSLPTPTTWPTPSLESESSSPDLTLHPTDVRNHRFLNHQMKILELKNQMESISVSKAGDFNIRRSILLSQVKDHLDSLEQMKEFEWSRQRPRVNHDGNPIVQENTWHHFQPLLLGFHPLAIGSMLLGVVLHYIFGISQAGSQAAVWITRFLLKLTLQWRPPSTSRGEQSDTELLESIRTDVRRAVEKFDLLPTIVEYVCCPTCFCLYHPDSEIPDNCESQELEKAPGSKKCGAPLFSEASYGKTDGPKRTPIRRFGYQPLEKWLAKIISIVGVEALMDNPWILGPRSPNEPWTDIWDLPTLHEMPGPDLKGLFSLGDTLLTEDAEGRLAFGLNVDWFNPYDRAQRGLHYSVGVIFMTLLNLPWEIRSKVEYVYLAGVIPGPKEPDVDQMNHLLRPLVDALLRMYKDGFLYSRTALYPKGRLFRGVLVPLICDIKAARKVSGQASEGSQWFCSFCRLLKTAMNNLDIHLWPRRNWSTHKVEAEAYRDAKSKRERNKAWKKFKVRYSELLRLPYWDPIKNTVVDPMHNLFLGLLHFHVRHIFGMHIKVQGVDEDDEFGADAPVPTLRRAAPNPVSPTLDQSSRSPASPNVTPRASSATAYVSMSTRLPATHDAEKAEIALSQGNEKRLGTFIIQVLKDMCTARGLHVLGEGYAHPTAGRSHKKVTKARLAHALIEWQRSPSAASHARSPATQNAPAPTGSVVEQEGIPQALDQSINKAEITIGKRLLKFVWLDQAKTTYPSWVGKPPPNLGSPGHGTLKADTWRTVCTVNLVITMIRLWGDRKPANPGIEDTSLNSVEKQKRVVRWKSLNNFIHLVIAVKLATADSIAPKEVDAYESHLLDYLMGLRSLYPYQKWRPNHHMAIHLVDCFRRFGPVHAWWTFPFERFNGILKGFNTNKISGVMELTFMRSFCIAANLKRMFTSMSDRLPEELNGLKAYLSTLFTRNATGTPLVDLLSTAPAVELPEDVPSEKLKVLKQSLRTALLRKLGAIGVNSALLVQPLKSLRSKGRTYARSHVHSGNSRIIYDVSGHRVAGEIREIFIYKHGDTREAYFAVHRFQDLSPEHAELDPYRKFPELDVRLYYNKLSPDVEIISHSEVICHVCCCPYKDISIGQDCLVVVSLDRLGPARNRDLADGDRDEL